MHSFTTSSQTLLQMGVAMLAGGVTLVPRFTHVSFSQVSSTEG